MTLYPMTKLLYPMTKLVRLSVYPRARPRRINGCPEWASQPIHTKKTDRLISIRKKMIVPRWTSHCDKDDKTEIDRQISIDIDPSRSIFLER